MPPSTREREVILETGAGALRGAAAAGVSCFRAIPFAEPPLGERRFAAPRPRAPWAGLRDAVAPGPVAPQAPSRLRHVMGDFERAQSEDCLTLSVWTPAADRGKRPVVVWLHGGAFMSGGGDLAWYDGARWAREGDVVVVAPNYRLGALGFLHLPGICEGNLGLADQALALDWVQAHIAAFGGDPERVTLAGQSAGGMSIALLLARGVPLPAHRAILMSAPLGIEAVAPAAASRIGEAFVRALGTDPLAADALACLQRATTAQVLDAQAQAARWMVEQGPVAQGAPPFMPVADGRFLPVPADWDARLRQAAGRIDSLAGWVHDESTAFGPLPVRTPMTRAVFADPTRHWAQAAGLAGRRAYLYRFDWAPHGSPFGATHCIDLPFAFGTLASMANAPMLGGLDAADLEPLSARVRAHWLRFVRDGDPGWPAVHGDAAPCMRFDRVDELMARPTLD